MSEVRKLPTVPAKHSDFLKYVHEHPGSSMVELLKPYRAYDQVLREVFAQEPSHPVIKENHLNIVPVYPESGTVDVRIRARDVASESDEVREKYIMPLADDLRKPNGTRALVDKLKDFQTNFNLFSENSLSDLDWSNVVAAGSSVVSSLLPVPEAYKGSKRGLRAYYHEDLAPASDVDLFLYGLTEEQAIEKIKQIEQSIRDSILEETTTVRTKNAITIVSHYPTRHVQIVLRIYKSVAEILTGFDVDCSCAAYDGKQLWLAPRAVASYITQTNHVDLSRRSPSYENRLSKYSRRGFEVMFSDLDRQRIDPTIFERSFKRTVGLARLLILEKLPSSNERDAYIDQRRRERGRPQINRYNRFRYTMHGNIKDQYDDEIAEWVEQDEVSDYHTFTIPYGEKFHAKKIEKLLYTKDLLLNAEWNKPKDREVNLHRHPAFFGHADDVMGDCCGYCPKPSTLEEEEVAEEESKIYVSGTIDFIKDDAGRQAIGSFNPITETDWTEMAYVGNTARLCQAIVDGDLEHVQDWLSQENSDPNRRDITGRTPLHLACMLSTPEIVKCLVDSGARMIARLADGRTALHLASTRGDAEIVKTLLLKSEENAEEEAVLSEQRREAKLKVKRAANPTKAESEDSEMSDVEILDDEESDLDSENEDGVSRTTGSFVEVKPDGGTGNDNLLDGENKEDPDIYDVDVVAWDSNASPLHLAIINGHTDVVEELVGSFGADILLPIKLFHDHDKSPRAAILTLVLALALPFDKAKEMAAKLIELGASAAQADMSQITPLHAYATKQPEALQVLFDEDGPAVSRAINHLAVGGSSWYPSAFSPLMSAIDEKNSVGALRLLSGGAKAQIEFSDFIQSVMMKFKDVANKSNEHNMSNFYRTLTQPIITAVHSDLPEIAIELLRRDADPNTLTTNGYQAKEKKNNGWNHQKGETILDLVQYRLKALREFEDEAPDVEPKRPAPRGDEAYIAANTYYPGEWKEGPYRSWMAKLKMVEAKKAYDRDLEHGKQRLKDWQERKGVAEKEAAIAKMIESFEQLEAELIKKGAKPFYELHPDIEKPQEQQPYHGSMYPYTGRESTEDFKLVFALNVPELTGESREAYLDLFDAACSGDLERIKELTLAPRGPNKDIPPLKIAVTGDDGYSPFSLAFFRGHFDTARAILDIARSQYQPREMDGIARYSMNPTDSDDSASEADDDDRLRIFERIVDDKYTTDIVQELANQVKSHIMPHEMLGWRISTNYFGPMGNSFFTYKMTVDPAGHMSMDFTDIAVEADDIDLLRRVLSLSTEFAPPGTSPIKESNFQEAVRKGRTRLLSEMIKHSGVGIPLDEIVNKSGVEVKEKPKYYQGLTVLGKKRKDWADAGRNMGVRPQHKDPPLLLAAFNACIDSVEWFSSSAPLRHYNEYADANKNDKKLQRLAQAVGGFDKAISNWLDSRSNLALHCAVMARPSNESVRLVSYLLKRNPESLEVRSVDGHTPLSLAFALQRTAIAKVLVAAGADQSVRDYTGNNLLHLVLAGGGSGIGKFSKGLTELTGLIDKRLLPSMILERSAVANPGSLTPLALWLHNSNISNSDLQSTIMVLSTILDLSAPDHKDLEFLDGSGNSPVHFAVRQRLSTVLQMMLHRRPDLLYRENATGSTPVELAHDAWTSSALSKLESNRNVNQRHYYGYSQSPSILNQQPETFLPKDVETRTETEKIYDLCRNLATNPRKRKLVSLVEANEVAKRIAGTKSNGYQSRRVRRNRHGYDYGLADENENEPSDERRTDEVSQWLGTARQWNENKESKEDVAMSKALIERFR